MKATSFYHKFLQIISFFTLFLTAICFPLKAHSQKKDLQPFKVELEIPSQEIQPGKVLPMTVRFLIPPGHFLYDDKTSVFFENSAGLVILKTDRPPPVPHQDPFIHQESQVYLKTFEQVTYLQVPESASLGKRSLMVTVRYQGCSEDFCYRPVQKKFILSIKIVSVPSTIRGKQVILPEGEKAPIQFLSKGKSFWELLHETNPERLLDQGKIVLLALAFVGGILTSLTPCVLPIIPLTLAFIGVRPKQKGNIIKVGFLVLGMVTIYSSLGFMAATLGLKFGFLFQNKFFVLYIAVLFLLMGLILFDLVPFHFPHRLQKIIHQWGGESLWGNFLAGSTIGLIASPCVGPLIAPLLLIAAREQDRLYGFFLLLNYGLGMGVLFFLLGSVFLNFVKKLKSGYWTHFLKKGLGVLMLIPAFYYGGVFVKPYFENSSSDFWIKDLNQGITLAQKENKLIILDFYADWCPPCIELDKRTFSTPEVRAKAKDFVMVQLNCTFDNATCREATKKYQVIGWPTVLFLDHGGAPIEGIKVEGGFVDKVKMLNLMEKALSQSQQKDDTPPQ